MMKPVDIKKEEREKVGGGDSRKQEEREKVGGGDILNREIEAEDERRKKLERESDVAYAKENLGFTINNPKKKRADLENTEDTTGDKSLKLVRPRLVDLHRRVDYRHWAAKKLSEMHDGDWSVFKEDFSISYEGKGDFYPIRSWQESNLDTNLLRAVERSGLKIPSPIQMAAIPLALQNRDVIGIARTSTGKTAAFVLPILNHFTTLDHNNNDSDNDNHGPYAVVMAPSLELVHQIEQETVELACYLGIKVVGIQEEQWCIQQVQGCKCKCDVLIATPGALFNCLELLKHCKYLLLDGANRMIEMQMPQVCAVLDAMPDQRTIYMSSATTMTHGVERLARNYLRNPVVVDIGMPSYYYDKMVELETFLNRLNTADDDDDVAKKRWDITATVQSRHKRFKPTKNWEWDTAVGDVYSTPLQSRYNRHVIMPMKWDWDAPDDAPKEWDRDRVCHRYTPSDIRPAKKWDSTKLAWVYPQYVFNYDMPANIET